MAAATAPASGRFLCLILRSLVILLQFEVAASYRAQVDSLAHLARLEDVLCRAQMMVVSQFSYTCESFFNVLICQRARLEMRLRFLRIDPFRLYTVGVDTRSDIELVANDHERNVRVVCCRLKGLLPLDHFFVRVEARDVVNEDAAVCAPVESDTE